MSERLGCTRSCVQRDDRDAAAVGRHRSGPNANTTAHTGDWTAPPRISGRPAASRWQGGPRRVCRAADGGRSVVGNHILVAAV